MIEIAALVLGTVATALIALVVYAKDRESVTNKLFIALAVGLVGWSLTTYFSLHTATNEQTLLWIRWVMFFVVTQNTAFFLLVRVFPYKQAPLFKKKRYMLAVLYSLVVAVAAISPYLFIEFKNDSPQPGPAMPLFMLHALIFAVGGIVGLVVRYRRAWGSEKAQLRYFLAGTVVLFTLVPLANFVLPLAFENSVLVALSPLYTLAFASIIAYAIVAKRLFDIRLAVARAVAYVSSLGVIALLYGGIVLAISSLEVFGHQSLRTQQVEYVGFALAAAVLYPPVKRYFAKATNRILYQDAYDAQDLMNRLNRELVATVAVDELIVKTLDLVGQSLKTEYALVMFWYHGVKAARTVGTTNKLIDEAALDVLRNKISARRSNSRIILADELGSEDASLRGSLIRNNIYFISKMGSGSSSNGRVSGMVILGPKKSGNPYSKQDVTVMEAITNELAIAIQNALRFEEIQQFNVTLQQKIDEATKQLRHSNERLKLLDQTKDDFISMASHQLRTPLTSVKGYVSMVLDGDGGKINASQRKLLTQSFASAQRMVYLISDLLNVSRLRTGKFTIEAAESDLAKVVGEELDQLTETAKGRGLGLTYHKPARFPTLMLDETKIRQVIMNFADNAVYYTPTGGQIDVYLEDKGETIEFRVVDNGIGVPKHEQHHLFTKFYRAHNAKTARPDGTGLGLFMAKKVIIAQGGAIIFKSTEGEGSTFGFTFPKSALQMKAILRPGES